MKQLITQDGMTLFDPTVSPFVVLRSGNNFNIYAYPPMCSLNIMVGEFTSKANVEHMMMQIASYCAYSCYDGNLFQVPSDKAVTDLLAK